MKITKGEGGLVADEDLFATQDGKLVGAEDSQANSLVARAGAVIPESLVQSLGIKETAQPGHEKPEKHAEPAAPEKHTPRKENDESSKK